MSRANPVIERTTFCRVGLEPMSRTNVMSSLTKSGSNSAKLVKPDGHVFFSTINRNPKAYLFAIVGAEYMLRLLPKGTHDYSKFIRPSELERWSREAGLELQEITGMSYNPLTTKYSLGRDVDVNYLTWFRKL